MPTQGKGSGRSREGDPAGPFSVTHFRPDPSDLESIWQDRRVRSTTEKQQLLVATDHPGLRILVVIHKGFARSTAMDNAFVTEDTEETVTCLSITVYHPEQEHKKVFHALKFCQQQQLRADELVKFGRDPNFCLFNFADRRVSRIQFALHFFKYFGSTVSGFEIKNLSKRVTLIVDNVNLAYLNKVDLPGRCLVRFGDYEMLMQQQVGQSEDYFEIRFELAKTSPWQDRRVPMQLPTPDSDTSYVNSPTEMDEDEYMENKLSKMD